MPYFDLPCRRGRWLTDDLGDRDALLARDRRHETVHLAVQLQRLDDLRAKHLQRAAVVVQPHAGRPRDQPVGDASTAGAARRTRPSGPSASRRRCRRPASSVATMLGMSRGSFCRSPSEVTIEAAARVGEAGGERRRLAEVAAEADHAQARIDAAAAAPGSRSSRRCCHRRRR